MRIRKRFCTIEHIKGQLDSQMIKVLNLHGIKTSLYQSLRRGPQTVVVFRNGDVYRFIRAEVS